MDEGEEDDPGDPSLICPVCGVSTYLGAVIECTNCELWFHCGCVGVRETDDVVQNPDVAYFCPTCIRAKREAQAKKKAKRTSPRTEEESRPRLKLKISLSKERPPEIVQNGSAPVEVHDDEEEEERKFLEAADAGDYEGMRDRELESVRNPKFRTARQKALAGVEGGVGHVALDYGYKNKEETEETLRQKEVKSRQRKAAQDVKREAEKRETVEKLLNKKKGEGGEADVVKEDQNQKRDGRKEAPVFRYRLTAEVRQIEFPAGYVFPVWLPPKRPLPPVVCVVDGCENPKKYCCSKTGRPVCSLACYKKNIEMQLEVPLKMRKVS